MTDADFIAWLQTSPEPTVLIEAVANVGGVETTRYVSNTGYMTGPTDTPPNQLYEARLVGGGKISAHLSLDGSGSSMAVGDVELINMDGALDSWLQDVWTSRSFKQLVGHASWPRADFRLVFDGVTSDIGSRDANVINLKMADKLQRLNTAATEAKLGGTSTNADRVLPNVLGEVHNIEPLLVDSATLTYQTHDGANHGAIERIIEVRVNGVVVAHTPNLAAGTFTLAASPPNGGVITCSVQGAKLAGVYVNTAAKLIELLVTTYGTDMFSGADLDTANLAAFNAANPQPVGVFLADRQNVLAICQQIAASVAAQVVVTPTGLLQLIKVALPAAGSPTAVLESRMPSLLTPTDRVPVKAAVKIGYCKNWTVQKNLETGIPAEHKALYGQEWMTSTAKDTPTSTLYKQTEDPLQTDTLLLVKADADARAAADLALWKVQRTVYTYDGAPELLLEALGGYQTVTYSRYGLSSGTDSQTVSIDRDWLNLQVTFGSLI